MVAQGIRFGMIGEREDLPLATRKMLDYAADKTAGGGDMRLTLALSYSGREEILQAARRLIRAEVKPGELDEATFRAYLYDPDLPDPDLLIRTSGEIRISNFLLFESAYTEFFFTPKLWPDFDEADLHEALESFAGRGRRFGRTDEHMEED